MRSIAIAAALVVAGPAFAAQNVPFSCAHLEEPTGNVRTIPDGWSTRIYDGAAYMCPPDASIAHKPTMADDIKDILKRLDRIETLLEMK